MGRYSVLLSPQLADLAGVAAGQRAIDVGCGPGALTRVLVDRLGADAVAAVDPSASFVEAIRARYPGVDVRSAGAEALPFEDDIVDVALAQLVVHFMTDPVARHLRDAPRDAAGRRGRGLRLGPRGRDGSARAVLADRAGARPDGRRRVGSPGRREGHLRRLFIERRPRVTSRRRHSPPTSSTPTSTLVGAVRRRRRTGGRLRREPLPGRPGAAPRARSATDCRTARSSSRRGRGPPAAPR